MIQCFKCKTVFESPTDNDAFRGLFDSFGSPGVEQAERVGSAYLARKAGWVDEGGVVWMCPECVKEAKSVRS